MSSGHRGEKEAATATELRPRQAPREGRALRVTVTVGPERGTTIVVPRSTLVIGRSHVADVRLSDPTVSSFHVEVTSGDDGLSVTDLKSSNGTFYAGVKLANAVVPSGTLLDVGASQIRLETDAPLVDEVAGISAFGELRGNSRAMRELFVLLNKLARTDLSLLLEGPTGSGKELAARAVHAASPRVSGPFTVLDCASIPESLAESVLFGHEKGAFTGANESRPGVFESAHGGTVFLDEVGELPLDLQPKLLRVLERREVVRVGGRDVRPISIRIVCATWRDLRSMVNTERFREDLYYRIAQARVPIPRLDDRKEDISMLVAHFLKSRSESTPGARAIAPDALGDLRRRDYPGNVRELKSVVERAAAVAEGPVITLQDLAFERMLSGESRRVEHGALTEPVKRSSSMPVSNAPADEPLVPFKDAKRSVIDEFEKQYLERLLARSGQKITRAAQLAGLERHTLRDLFRKHGLLGTDS